jgi:hypothetical protein
VIEIGKILKLLQIFTDFWKHLQINML